MRVHHLGIVVTDIETTGRQGAEQLGLRPLTPVIVDPIQRVKVQFWGNEESSTQIELVEATDSTSPVSRATERGGGPNHICYEVDDLAKSVKAATANGALCVVPPVEAVAFDGRPIAFCYFRGIGLVEYVQAPKTR